MRSGNLSSGSINATTVSPSASPPLRPPRASAIPTLGLCAQPRGNVTPRLHASRIDILLAKREQLQQCQGFLSLLERHHVLQHRFRFAVLSDDDRLPCISDIRQHLGSIGHYIIDRPDLGGIAHSSIRAYGEGGDHDISNGLLLRTDIHRLFDLGYVTVTERNQFAVSERLKADFDNGVHYYAMQGTEIAAPRPGFTPPAREALQWHRENRYLG